MEKDIIAVGQKKPLDNPAGKNTPYSDKLGLVMTASSLFGDCQEFDFNTANKGFLRHLKKDYPVVIVTYRRNMESNALRRLKEATCDATALVGLPPIDEMTSDEFTALPQAYHVDPANTLFIVKTEAQFNLVKQEDVEALQIFVEFPEAFHPDNLRDKRTQAYIDSRLALETMKDTAKNFVNRKKSQHQPG